MGCLIIALLEINAKSAQVKDFFEIGNIWHCYGQKHDSTLFPDTVPHLSGCHVMEDNISHFSLHQASSARFRAIPIYT